MNEKKKVKKGVQSPASASFRPLNLSTNTTATVLYIPSDNAALRHPPHLCSSPNILWSIFTASMVGSGWQEKDPFRANHMKRREAKEQQRRVKTFSCSMAISRATNKCNIREMLHGRSSRRRFPHRPFSPHSIPENPPSPPPPLRQHCAGAARIPMLQRQRSMQN